MTTATRIWGVWDCTELLSLHLTREDALDAREHHLNRCRCFTDDQDVLPAAVEIRCMSVLDDRESVENQSPPTVAVQDGSPTCHDQAI